MPAGDRVALQASFYGGLARFNTAKYAEAEKAFAFVASRLPLPGGERRGRGAEPAGQGRGRPLPAGNRDRPQRRGLPLQPRSGPPGPQ